MTVREPSGYDRQRAELLRQGVYVPPGAPLPVGAKGAAEAKRRFD